MWIKIIKGEKKLDETFNFYYLDNNVQKIEIIIYIYIYIVELHF